MRPAVAWCLSALLLGGAAQAAPRHVVGPTYPIAEPDVLAEIRAKAARMDWTALMRARNPSSFSAFHSASLPNATRDRSFLFDPTYTLPRDVVDAKGAVLYPAGTTINVYARQVFPGRTIVIAAEPEQLRWLDTIAKPTDQDKVLLAGADFLQIKDLIGSRRAYALEARAVARFGLQAVPSIVQQDGKALRVREFRVEQAKAEARESSP
jgi:conjugal transfer pilus assembly protein TraW